MDFEDLQTGGKIRFEPGR